MEAGYFQIYTGNGKGKTTAAIGLAIRALGAGLSVYFGQFIKGMRYSEIAMLERLASMNDGKNGFDEVPAEGSRRAGALAIRQYGRGCFIFRDPGQADMEAASAGLAEARNALVSGAYDLVILDEINVAIKLGVVQESDAIAIAQARPSGVELVMTGRYAPDSLIHMADLVTEMREIKHYYAAGVQARDGIER